MVHGFAAGKYRLSIGCTDLLKCLKRLLELVMFAVDVREPAVHSSSALTEAEDIWVDIQ